MKPARTLLLWALAMILVIGWAPAVLADWHDGDDYKMHYPQKPDPEGWDICVVDQYIADDFECTESGKITDIHIWFSIERDQEINPDILIADISIWSDAMGRPGTRLWTWNGGGQVNFIAPYGMGQQGWACPEAGIARYPDHYAFHQVNITEIPEPFRQREGVRYWLVVKVMDPPDPKIGWKTSQNMPPGQLWGSPAMWSKDPDAGMPWQDVVTAPPDMPGMTFQHDMAFVITGKAKPPTIQVGPWIVAEPWHQWFGPGDRVPVQLHPADPCEVIKKVDFFYSLNGHAPAPDWIPLGTDEDGSDTSLTTTETGVEPNTFADGWAAYLNTQQIPTPGYEPTIVTFKASVYHIDSFFDVFTELELDPSPPSDVEVVTEVEGTTLIVDVNPNPDYPDDIDYIVIDVEKKPDEYVKGIPPLNQLDPTRAYGGGYHCAPTATASCLKYFEGKYGGNIAGGLSGDDLTDELARYLGCNSGGLGTYFGEWVSGIRDWINDHGGGYSVRSFRYFDWDTARDELERCQDVLLRLEWPNGAGHALTFNSVHNITDEIDLMDPYGGTISWGDFDPATGRLSNFEGASGNSGVFTHMIIICPDETDPGGGGDPIPGPNPGPYTLDLDPGKYFVRVTVVDVTNHAATLIDIVDVDIREPEYGDAPEAALAYPSTCKIGAFPTCVNVGPAGFIRHDSTGLLFFGPLVDMEGDGNAGFCSNAGGGFPPYDQDECFADNDAGLIMPPAYTIQVDATGAHVVPCGSQTGSLGTVCQTATWGNDIDIHVENRTNEEAYVNVLVDWNKSGEWSGQSVCPPCLGGVVAVEHVLVDQRVPAGFSGPLSLAMGAAVKSFAIGPNRGYVWTRFTITPNRIGFSDWNGEGIYPDGESEDYLIHVKPAPVTHECDWNEGDPHKMHYPQLPNLTETGMDVDMFWTPLADDFKCSESGYITDIHFWGSFSDDCLPPGGPGSLTFQVAIYSDIPATPDSHSMPGDILWGPHTFGPCDYSVRRMADGPEDWYDPVTGLFLNDNHQQAYQYNICIDQDMAFHQEEGRIYWLEIKDIVDIPGFEPEYTFGWKTTMLDLGFNDDAVYRASTSDDWIEMIYPDQHEYAGESINLAFVITGQPDPQIDIDWGDAPDPTYPTLAASIGASHAIVPNIFMGNTVDPEPDGQPTAAADGDDTDADGDDEDGVTFDTPLIPGQMAQITVNASVGGPFISVWIDFHGDGSWAEVTDYVVQSVIAVAGNNVFPNIPVPADAVPGTPAYVRVRFTTNPQIGFAGHATNGEVEDYVVPIEQGYEPKPPVPHLKWSQPPIEIDPVIGQMPTYCGWDELSYSTKEAVGLPAGWKIAADDFRCLGRMPIASVHWWGSYKNWTDRDLPPGPHPAYWHIGFWSNVPVGAGTDNFSRPDKLLHQVVVKPAEVEIVWVGMDMFPDPAIAPESCFQYYVKLQPRDYFWQNKYIDPETQDTVFWISITAVYQGFPGPQYPWGWKTRPAHWMDDAVTFTDYRDEWTIGDRVDPANVVPLENGSVCDVIESYDLAFELDTDPNYVKWEQPFTGLRYWPHYEDEESMAYEIEPSPNKWVQYPDTTLSGLHAHDSTTGRIILADDWVCDGGDVTDLHWYGNYELGVNNEEMRGRGIQSFHLSIHRIAAHACVPGDEVWSMDVPFTAITETDTGLVNSEGGKIYLYEYDLEDPYPQIQGNKYWLDISAKSNYPDSPAIWRWQEAGRSPTPIQCGAASRTDLTPWQTITWPPIPPDQRDRYSDMAFAITSETGEPRVEIQRLVADDWQCKTKQPVTAAVWWGSYIGYRYRACECPLAAKPIRPDYFLLTIWTDVPAGVDGTYSHPGKQVWKYRAYDYDQVLVGYDKHPEGEPGTVFYGREPVFRYSVRFPRDQWYYQLEDDAILWFSAVAVYKQGTDPTYPWGWTNHRHVFNDDAVAGFYDPAAGTWFWEELFDQTGTSEDMSFILFTEPVDCFPSYFTTYPDWVALGKPLCWCNSGVKAGADGDYQCDGDAGRDTETFFKYRVFGNDLALVVNNWKRKVGDPLLDPCADVDHKPETFFKYRVFGNDLATVVGNWKKKDTDLPGNCGLPSRPE